MFRCARVRIAALLVSVLLLPALPAPAFAEAGVEVTSADYPAGNEFHGAPGQPGDFTFSSNGDKDVQSYFYGLNDGTCLRQAVPDEPGGSVTLTLTPRSAGPNRIYARTVDASGRSSACVSVYYFLVAPPSDPVAYFAFDEGQGNRAADLVNPDQGATLSDGVEWVRGRVGTTGNPNTDPAPRMEGTAVHINGRTDGEITAEHSTVDTSGSFSVSTWVKLEGTDADHVAVAQEGAAQSAFQLGYQGESGQWVFRMSPEDEHRDGSQEWAVAASTASAEAGVWTHLLGTHDDRTGEITLYVDGIEQGTATHPGSWNARGPLAIGRVLSQGAGEHHWSGAIDDVLVWNRLVLDEAVASSETNSEVWRLANRPLASEGRWMLDEWDGRAVADATDHGLDATLHGDPLTAWNTADNDITFSPALRLNGDKEYVEAPGPALRTDRSFSIAAWVRLDETGVGVDATAVSQAGAHQSGFQLGYQGSSDTWVFKMAAHDDAADPGSIGGVYASSAWLAQPGKWTHLVGIYDHTGGELVLHVDGTEASRVAVDHAWHAEGPLRIGSAQHGGSNTDHWPGDIDDVHAYQGVLGAHSISNVSMGFFPTAQH
ncbi:LamG domain-containing protein [Nocardiopsis ganjiahuensis]|uniref:LamG domain-containing protein n=1 Tax=Nocardiopsis ganjiahuensis TaxID=239984 RepID=UPI00034D5EF9|nr:LamG domain-containing protein [Nocardiopsis ganjiahuensis]